MMFERDFRGSPGICRLRLSQSLLLFRVKSGISHQRTIPVFHTLSPLSRLSRMKEWLTPKCILLVLSRVFGSFQIAPACFRMATGSVFRPNSRARTE